MSDSETSFRVNGATERPADVPPLLDEAISSLVALTDAANQGGVDDLPPETRIKLRNIVATRLATDGENTDAADLLAEGLALWVDLNGESNL